MSQGVGALVLVGAVLLVLSLGSGEFRFGGISIIIFAALLFFGFMIFMRGR